MSAAQQALDLLAPRATELVRHLNASRPGTYIADTNWTFIRCNCKRPQILK